jgi:hypothetical protein
MKQESENPSRKLVKMARYLFDSVKENKKKLILPKK